MAVAFAYRATRGKSTSHRTPITPNIAAWYRYKRGLTNTSGKISAWADASTNSRDLVQTTAANRPTFLSDGTVVFDGSAQFMQSTFTLNQPCTIYMLVNQLTWTLNDVLIDGVTAAAQLIQTATTPGLTVNAGSALSANAALPVNTWGVLGLVLNGASSLFRINAGGPATAVSGNAGSNALGGITLGAARTPANYANIAVRELLVYSVAHDGATRHKVARYMGSLAASVGGI